MENRQTLISILSALKPSQRAEVVCERPSQLVIWTLISSCTDVAELELTADESVEPGILNFSEL